MRLESMWAVLAVSMCFVTSAFTSASFDAKSPEADHLIGGEEGFCKVPVVDVFCNECRPLIEPYELGGYTFIYKRCDSEGATHVCAPVSSIQCVSCDAGLSEQTPCGGDFIIYAQPYCTGLYLGFPGGCSLEKDNAFTTFSSGSCPSNCPGPPGSGD